MREAAYKQIADAMGIGGFGIPEVKNKIKKFTFNLRARNEKVTRIQQLGCRI